VCIFFFFKCAYALQGLDSLGAFKCIQNTNAACVLAFFKGHIRYML